MTTVRLALGFTDEGTTKVKMEEGLPSPSFLMSYWYREFFDTAFPFARSWVLDSGAYSAHTSGGSVDLLEFHEYAHHKLQTDPKLREVFALDIIGDWRKTLQATEHHWANDVPAIPTFHIGSPWSALIHMTKVYPKIAVGGLVGCPRRKKHAWLNQVFARVWPKKIHALGVLGPSDTMAFPFHSADSSSWSRNPRAFACWASLGAVGVSVRGKKDDLSCQINHYMRLEQQLQHRWAKEMAQLEAL